MLINWEAFLQVFVAALLGASVVVTFYALGLRLLVRGGRPPLVAPAEFTDAITVLTDKQRRRAEKAVAKAAKKNPLSDGQKRLSLARTLFLRAEGVDAFGAGPRSCRASTNAPARAPLEGGRYAISRLFSGDERARELRASRRGQTPTLSKSVDASQSATPAAQASRKSWNCIRKKLERAMGFEPTTPTLARLCSTPELRPPARSVCLGGSTVSGLWTIVRGFATGKTRNGSKRRRGKVARDFDPCLALVRSVWATRRNRERVRRDGSTRA